MKKYLVLSAITLAIAFNTSCTTSMYGHQPEQTDKADEYTFKVYTGGFAFEGTATERAQEESEKFMIEHGYKSYKIVSSHYELVPSGFVFKVQFSK
jgi:hypothetical protein